MYVRPGGARPRVVAAWSCTSSSRPRARLGYRALVLETGLRQPEAIALYESAGYTTIPNFGFYKESPLSVCYRKELDGRAGDLAGVARRRRSPGASRGHGTRSLRWSARVPSDRAGGSAAGR